VPDTQNLTRGLSVTLDATGAGQVSLGPDAPGPANWRVTGIVVQTNRPGKAPIPRVQIYLNTVDPTNSIGVSFNGSFQPFGGEQNLSRGQHIIVAWTGGQSGDLATATVNGEKWN